MSKNIETASIVYEGEDSQKPLNNCYALRTPSFLSCFLSIIIPCSWIGSCIIIKEREEGVITNWGKYIGTIKKPGLYCRNPCGVFVTYMTTANKSSDLDSVKVADSTGSPLMISGVVTYRVTNPKKALFNVFNTDQYVNTQALSVMKSLASQHTYYELKSDEKEMNKNLILKLEERLKSSGIKILNFEFSDLSYAPEIAQVMLVRQQASAFVDARKIIASGASQISLDVLEYLKKNGLKISDEMCTKISSNLLITICGGSKPQPTIDLS